MSVSRRESVVGHRTGSEHEGRQPPQRGAVPFDGREREPWTIQRGLRAETGVQAGRVGLHIPGNITFESWCHIGNNLTKVTSSSGWWLGDWLVYGERRFPNRYRVVVRETTLDYQTLRNYAWVARKFPVNRRRDTLSLQHHAEIAALPEADQDVWLDAAERGKWSAQRLRKELRRRRELANDPAWDGIERTPVKVVLNLDNNRNDLWKHAAEASELSLLDWIAKVLDDAASETVAPDADADRSDQPTDPAASPEQEISA